MVFSQSWGEKIKRNSQSFECIEKRGVMMLNYLFRRDPFTLGAERDRRAMTIRAGNHQHLIAFKAVITSENISRQEYSGNMAHVQRAIRIGPGNGDKNLFGHVFPH